MVEKLERTNEICLERQIRSADWFAWSAFVFMLACRFITIALVFDISAVSGASIDNVLTTFEANPIAEWAFKLQNVGFVVFTLLLPACVMALYLLFRSRCKQGRLEPDLLYFFTSLIFFMTLLNVINDSAYYLSRMF